MLKRVLKDRPGFLTKTVQSIKGVSEETTTGVHRLYELSKKGKLPFPAINGERQRHQVEVRQSLWLQGIAGRRDPSRDRRHAGGQGRLRRGLRRCRQGSAASLRNGGARVLVTEVDPICALQAAMEGYEVVTMEEAAPRADIFVTATGNEGVLTVDHMRAMKNMAIVSNIGHFDSEIEIAGLANMKWTEIKPQVDEVEFPDGKKIIVLSKGRLVNLGNATGHPSFVMSASFTNQTLPRSNCGRVASSTRTKSMSCQASGREGRCAPPRKAGREADQAQPEAGRIISACGRRAVQARPLSLLSESEEGGERSPPFSLSPAFSEWKRSALGPVGR